uniref:Uncharacterized protein n=1 Tax=Fagus sylvatica TaxID=28930 RepID=A0A2N9EUD3_FAGSY
MFQTTISPYVIIAPFLFHLLSTAKKFAKFINPESQHSSTSSSMEVCPGPGINCKIHLHKFYDESIPTNTIDDDALKSANMLLDEELNPHLSDCGLAALTPNTERQVDK